MHNYNKKFFDYIDNQSFESAELILSEIYKSINFKSIIDVGCGTGSWLRAAKSITKNLKLVGIDGKYAVKTFKCEEAKFITHDLEKNFNNKINIKSDLVICMEVAEHLSFERSTSFINNLCSLSDTILFGAAVKHQRGTLHINEQPQSFWIKLFTDNDYIPHYLPRKKLWNNEKILKTPYYISNSFLFIKKNNKNLKNLTNYKVKENDVIDIVHPIYLDWLQDKNSPFRTHFYYFLPSLYKALKRRFLMIIK